MINNDLRYEQNNYYIVILLQQNNTWVLDAKFI